MNSELQIEESAIEMKLVVYIIFLTAYAIIIGYLPFFIRG